MRRHGFVVVCLTVGWLVASAAEAQQGASAIRGRVTDEQKGVLPGATVTVTHQESGISGRR